MRREEHGRGPGLASTRRARRRAAAMAATGIAAIALGVAGPARADTARVQSTFDTIDADLLDGLIRPEYAKAQPGDTLSYVGNGTGVALDKARAGEADVVVTHAPTLEAQFVADGYSIDGRAIFYSDYVIIGPASDPAGVLDGAPHDAVSAFEKIAAAGEAGKATFVTRGENSGTNVQEELIWGLTTSVTKVASPRGGARYVPGTSAASPPTWYRKSGVGQGANVQATSTCVPASYPNGSCYTMTDRGTFNNLVNRGIVTNLKVVSDRNAPGVRGGENLLVNPFSAYLVNPDRFAADKKPNVAAGQRFLDFLTSESFQSALLGFPSVASPAFFPDAAVKVEGTVPQTAVIGSTVPITLSLTDRLPGAGAVGGQPVQLQGSTDGGRSFADIGGPVASGADGKVALSPTLSGSTLYRVMLPRYGKFTGATTVLGPVVGTVPRAAGPTPLPSPAPAAAPDRTAPVASKLKLTATRLSFRVSEPGRARITVALRTTRTVKGRRITDYRTKQRLLFTIAKAGTVSKSLRRLAAGTYRVRITTVDRAGNDRTKTSLVKVRSPKGTKTAAKKG